MTILAIDTSNYPLGISLVQDNIVIAERITYLKKNHSARVMPAIDELMKECDLVPSDLSKIVVAEGPGSYTGLRIGVTIAKTLAWTLKIPLVAVSSLEVIAASAGRYFNGYIVPIIDARRKYVYTGLYRYNNGLLEKVNDDKYILINDLLNEVEKLKDKVLFVGHDVNNFTEEIFNRDNANFKISHQIENNPRPSELALIGMNRQEVDVHSFTPNYIRLAEAETNWLKENKKEQTND